MDRFLESCNFQKLNKEKVERLKMPITSKEMETVTKNLPKNISPWPDNFTSEFYQIFWDLLPLLRKLFQNIEDTEIFPYTFYEANITVVPKAEYQCKNS